MYNAYESMIGQHQADLYVYFLNNIVQIVCIKLSEKRKIPGLSRVISKTSNMSAGRDFPYCLGKSLFYNSVPFNMEKNI